MVLNRDFDIEVARGEVTGYANFTLTGINPNVGDTFEDLWDVGGQFVFPTDPETWEILSDDVNDISGGTGAQSVIITGLDVNYAEQTEIVILNGTTPIKTARTDWFRITSVVVISSGSTQSNIGNITLRVSGGGLIRSLIGATRGQTFNGFFTVPVDKSLFLSSIQIVIPKNEDVILRNLFLAFGTNTFLSGGDAPIYQSDAVSFLTSTGSLPEKTDFVPTVKSTNTSVSVALLLQGKLVDDAGSTTELRTF